MPDTPLDPRTAALRLASTAPERGHDVVNLAQFFTVNLSPLQIASAYSRAMPRLPLTRTPR